MSGYAASARVEGGSPRLVAAGESGSRGRPGRRTAVTLTPVDHDDRTWTELAGRPLGERIAARWADLCEAWSQMTFYLFDPESWRR